MLLYVFILLLDSQCSVAQNENDPYELKSIKTESYLNHMNMTRTDYPWLKFTLPKRKPRLGILPRTWLMNVKLVKTRESWTSSYQSSSSWSPRFWAMVLQIHLTNLRYSDSVCITWQFLSHHLGRTCCTCQRLPNLVRDADKFRSGSFGGFSFLSTLGQKALKTQTACRCVHIVS